MNRLFFVGIVGVLGAATLLALGGPADAQRMDPRRPTVLIVGPPGGPAPHVRVDPQRTGLSRVPLPAGALKIAWTKPTGLTLDQPALAGSDGTIAVVSARGDVAFFDTAGDERAAVRVGIAQAGPAVITSDGTVVYGTGSGEVVGVRRPSPHPRYVTRIGGERNVRAAPLALDDGGVVVATRTDLVLLDADGNVRGRATLPEEAIAPLVAWTDKIVAVGSGGAVFGWSPGKEPVRLGSFGAPIDGGAALSDGTLLAVIEGNHVAEVDLTRGGRTTRAISGQGLYLGPPSIRRGPNGAVNATVLALTSTRGFVVTLDPSGAETVRVPIASFTPQVLPDGGAPALVAPPHVPVVVDTRGAIAFSSTDGHVGVISPEGAVETIADAFCAKGAKSGVVGLTPVAGGSLAVVCDSGTVALLSGSGIVHP